MKIMTIFILNLLLAIGVSAQEQSRIQDFYSTSYVQRNSGSFGESAHLLTICYGFPATIHATINDVYDPNRSVIGPIKMMYEFAIRGEMGIAPKLFYARGTWNNKDRFGYTEMHIWALAAGATGYYHFNKLIPVKQIDLYAGVGFYFGIQKFIWDIDFPTDTDVEPIGTPTFSTGVRYYFTKAFGAYAELGITGGSYLDMGITFRFH